ncbi:Txe/YoeB family addiction module toxin [Frankia sp. Mgl5]|uniref:Txe/YoeB family addiction module toxin n=1 Tax=Frankiaceae TaxID=74712 RepID=UPI000DA50A27|nr:MULTISPECIES: Txe/YoeB family addiction module toxin [Frankiaceae]MCK9928252.1 Txe/YoeB family addiction module toxin [Frankia sp. Mgl5]TCJ33272.1 Txe/YoeB family addiction module toxin [Parafrankia sp. BMG5.11]SQD96914.1 toxin of the YoeB-YefM toxin-antitoxin system [Parafrankia sp. Ea1.12]
MKLAWTDHAWEDYLYWQGQDRRTLKRINALIADIKRDPEGQGIGKPELLRNNLAGLRSRRIDDEHRLVYAVEPGQITIISCRYHYQ